MNTIPLFKRDVLISIRPEYVLKILGGEKTVELRRRFPLESACGALAWIYATSPVKAVVGRVDIVEVLKLPVEKIWSRFHVEACIAKTDFDRYFAGLSYGHVICLKNPTELHREFSNEELRDTFGFVPPQSFRYLDRNYSNLLSNERLQTSSRHKRINRA